MRLFWPWSRPKPRSKARQLYDAYTDTSDYLTVQVTRGRGGRRRWRWQIEDSSGKVRAVSTVSGFGSREEALADATRCFSLPWYGSSGEELL